jgi:hypothetical protein
LTLELGGLTLGLREGVIVLIALVACYMLFVLLRMRRLRKPVAEAAPITPVIGDLPPAPANESESVPDLSEPAEVAVSDAWESARSELAEEMLRQSLSQEIAQLRDEVDAMRGELAALRDDMNHELGHLRAAQTVSPIYGDAMQMAAAGYEPAMIAERCGIARAEAELVVALAKSQEHGG